MKNSTIKKLDRQEIAELGLYNLGIYTFKGDLKTRVKGMKTTLRAEDEVHFENDSVRYEVIKIVATNDEGVEEFAIRLFIKQSNEYRTDWSPLSGCMFFR